MGGEATNSKQVGRPRRVRKDDAVKQDSVEAQYRELAVLCLKGVREAWDELYRKFTPLIRTTAIRCRVPSHCVEDVVNETFLGLLKSLTKGNYDPSRAELKTYIVGIATKTAVDYWHRFRMTQSQEGEVEERLPAETESRPDVLLEQMERQEIMRNAVKKLKELCRELLRLRYWEGLSFAEIGIILGSTERAVRTREGRCKDRLRDTLRAGGITP